MDRMQSIFAIHNMTDKPVSISALSLNLIGGETWHDLLSDEPILEFEGEIIFAPYQCRWITNRA